MAKPKNSEEIDFKTGMERLEEIVDSLEGGEIDLEEALKVFEEGIVLSGNLAAKLEKAEKRIRKLVEDAEGNTDTEVMEDGED
jgi:exodeoxyribonuclease VII small subunit